MWNTTSSIHQLVDTGCVLQFGYCKCCCCKHSHKSFCMVIRLHFSWVHARSGIRWLTGHIVTLCFILSGTAKDYFPKWLHHFTIPPAMYKGFSFSTLPTLVFFDYGHCSKHEVASCCGFGFHLPDGYWCWASFHVLSGHLGIFLWRNVYSSLLPIF